MSDLSITELTQTTLGGSGAFDVIMRAVRENLDAEFKAGRIKGPEYSTVYLGSLNLAMQTALQFVLVQRKNALEAELLQEQITLAHQQALNAVTEGEVLTQQVCLLKAQYDGTLATTLKTNEELALLAQKVATERAQTIALGVDADSVIGKQKALYGAQTDGFKRDAEQKAAKLLADTWSVRRTTDEATQANTDNLLNDATVGRAIAALLAGVGA